MAAWRIIHTLSYRVSSNTFSPRVLVTRMGLVRIPSGTHTPPLPRSPGVNKGSVTFHIPLALRFIHPSIHPSIPSSLCRSVMRHGIAEALPSSFSHTRTIAIAAQKNNTRFSSGGTQSSDFDNRARWRGSNPAFQVRPSSTTSAWASRQMHQRWCWWTGGLQNGSTMNWVDIEDYTCCCTL